MKKLILSLILFGNLYVTSNAQTPIVEKYTKLDVILLETPEKGSVIPTTDGGYFMSKGLTLSKYNSSNAVVWTQSLSASKAPAPFAYIHKINSICEDGNGGAIITGEFNGTIYYGNDSIAPLYTATGNGLYSSDAFIARINSSGKVWWHRFGESEEFSLGTDRGVSVKVINNKVYWLAHGKGLNLKFNNVNYPRTQYSNNLSLLCQLSIEGTVDWVNVTKGFSQPTELIVHGNNIFYTGFNNGVSTPIDFGNNISISYNQGSLFAVKFDNNGMAQWAITYDDDNGVTNFNGAMADNEGNIYIAGSGSQYSSSYGIRKSAGYLLKINGTDGKQVWTRVCNNSLKGPVFSNGKIYVAGNTSSSIYLQSGQNDSIEFKKSATTNGSEQWIAAFDKAGNITGSLKASVGGGFVGSTMEYLQATDNRVDMMGIFSTGNSFGDITLPLTGTNVGAYHIGFFSIKTGSSPNAIQKVNLENLKPVYPNPAKDYFIVETIDNSEIMGVSIYDISGKKFQCEHIIEQDKATVYTANFSKGIYLIEVNSKNGISVKKIIID